MKALANVGRAPIKRILSIDPASHSLAFAVVEANKILAKGKVNFPHKCDMDMKLMVVAKVIPLIIGKHHPDYLLVEQTIYIQNFATSRMLSYLVGGIRAQARAENVSTGDIGPLQWKPGLGVEFVRRAEIAEWTKEMGKREAKKKADFEKKERVRLKVLEFIPDLDEQDYDIIDAIAIGLWGLNNKDIL